MSTRRRRVRSLLGRAAVVLIGLLLIDSASGLVHRTGTRARVGVVGGTGAVGAVATGRRTFVVFPGHVMSGRLVAEAFRPYLPPDDVVIAVDYAERGVDVDAIYAQVRSALDAVRPSSLVVYGSSMGGMVAAAVLQRYAAAGTPYGRADLVLDASPSRAVDVRRPAVAFGAACLYRGGVLSTGVWAAISLLAPQPTLEPGADRRLVSTARSTGAWVGMPAATSQACFIGEAEPLAPGALDDVTSRSVYLHGVSDDADPSIDTRLAVAHWREALPRLVERTIPTRRAAWHVPLVERPAETVTAMLAALA